MFTVTLQRDGEDPFKLLYDHVTNSLTVESGEDALPYYSELDLNWKERETFSPEKPVGKRNKAHVLKIQLGLKCNYSCSYCNQAMHVGTESHTNIDDAVGFLESLDDWLEGSPCKIEFWGGEPLVYWKKLKILVPAIRERFPDATLVMITNGSLLDDEKFAFIDRYDIQIGMSHDGPGQYLRGPDPFEDPTVVRVVRRLVEERPFAFSINSVLTADNPDVNKFAEFFRTRVHPDIVVNFEGVVNHYEEDGLGVSRRFTRDDYETLVSSIKSNLNDAQKRSQGLELRVYDFLQSLVDRRPAQALGQGCGMDKEGNLAVDLKGNVTTCQNVGSESKHGLGTVFDMENVKLDTSWSWRERPDCGGCPYLQICGGGCMYLTDQNWIDTCENEYHFAKGLFEGTLEMMTGAKVIAFEGEHTRPKRASSNLINAVNVA